MSGQGEGATKLSSFDSALTSVGLENYNLIHLSSVIPPTSQIVATDRFDNINLSTWGDRAYVVMASSMVGPDIDAWAGLGWMQDGGGKGLFIEHTGSSEEEVAGDIQKSMDTMRGNRQDESFGSVESMIRGTDTREGYRCALVVALYALESW